MDWSILTNKTHKKEMSLLKLNVSLWKEISNSFKTVLGRNAIIGVFAKLHKEK